ncbi:2-dehydro-3-deoxygalactonokinase [Roseovarius arcticus]|uniref:2-dehydro-3-deoxygalactonokinase n=1 Tax=Roseovarius arcticus TaxID=2547404 RepID=UPI0011106E95|nr:2-dehydro-3-deoxygalactonokinase [Roseovarius arcticus]
MRIPWGALLAEGGRVTLYAVQDDAIGAHDFASLDEAVSQCGIPAARLVKLDDTSHVLPPAPTLIDKPGVLSAIQQASPAAVLPAAARVLIAGALAAQPDWDGILVLPERDVTHWVHVSAREIVSFQGAATGRLASALGATAHAFDEGALSDTMSRPERLAAQLNAASLTGGSAVVLGHLLGAELASMKMYWLGQDVRIIGDPAPYAAALVSQGITAEAVPRAQAWQAGLLALGQAAGLNG